MRRLLVIMALAAVLLQCCAVHPLMHAGVAKSRCDMVLAAPPVSTAVGIVLRRLSPLEPLLGHDAGLVVARHLVAASAQWPAKLATLHAGSPAPNDSLQTQSVRWQI